MRERVHASRTVFVLAAAIGSLALVVASASLSGQALPWRSAQDLPAFEAASIRETTNAETPNSRSRFQPGSYQATNITAHALIRAAYGLVVPEQVRGGPNWMDDTRFDIQATAQGADAARMRLMLQRLLIDRFRLSARTEKVELPVLALMVVREDRRLGERMKPLGQTCPAPAPVAPGMQAGVDQMECGQVIPGGGVFMARGVTMTRFAELVTGNRTGMSLDRMVVDRTSLTGVYAIDLRYTQAEQPGLRKPDTQDVLPEFATAIREQLGLKLEPASAPVDAIVIERLERPTAN